MQHIDEHTIELYILGSDLVKKQVTEIELHLKECHGCRILAKQMKAFYQNAEDDLGKLSVPKETKTLVRVNKAVEQYYEPFAPPVRYQPNTPLAKMFYFIRRHSVVVSLSSFVLVAAIGWFLNDFIKSGSKDHIITNRNPSYPILDPMSGSLAIYNKDHDLLWSIPSKILAGANPDQLLPWYKSINIFDINEDGRNEVITALPLGDQTINSDTLRIISAEKDILVKKTFDEKVQFRGKSYNGHWTVRNINCGKFGANNNPEIFLLTDNGRSPNILFRLNNEGNTVGDYVHYGLQRMIVLENSAGEKKIFLCGQNDLGETDSLSFPVLIILDPEKINGKTESSCTPGFGLETSKAELYYINLSLIDLNYLWKTNGYLGKATAIKFDNKNAYDLWVAGTYEKENPVFEYILSEEMKVLSVKYSSGTLRLRQKLIDEGKIKGTFDDTYLNNLKNGVRYWDGKKWQEEPTMVNLQP